MTETEKLRALLAEARERLSRECDCRAESGCATARIRGSIDAALAEPVDDYDIDAELRLHKEDRLRLRVENLRLTRERDEARAEAAAAYQRGAEAMREAAAQECWRASDELADIPDMTAEQEQAQLCATRIRTLPLPEDKP